MARESGWVREVDWLDVFPWLGLVGAVSRAIWPPHKILLAMLGVWLTWAGWSAISWSIAGTALQDQAAVYRQSPWAHETGRLGWISYTPGETSVDAASRFAAHATVAPPAWYTRPFWDMFSPARSFAGVGLAFLCGLWAVAVWTFFGGVLTRLAAVELTRQNEASLFSAIGYASRRWRSYAVSALFPLLGVFAALVVPAAIAGLVARFDVGFFLVALLWPLGLLLGFVAATLLIAWLLGWPLIWATVSTEAADDPFDVFSRVFSYVWQRPFHYAFYVVVAAALGIIGWLIVSLLAELSLFLAAWGLSWGRGAQPTAEAIRGAGATAAVLAFWTNLVYFAVLAYLHSYFWTAATGVYLLLRYSRDGTPLDDVDLEDASELYATSPMDRLATDARPGDGAHGTKRQEPPIPSVGSPR